MLIIHGLIILLKKSFLSHPQDRHFSFLSFNTIKIAAMYSHNTGRQLFLFHYSHCNQNFSIQCFIAVQRHIIQSFITLSFKTDRLILFSLPEEIFHFGKKLLQYPQFFANKNKETRFGNIANFLLTVA